MQARQIQKLLLPALALFALVVGGNLLYRKLASPRRQAAATPEPQRDAKLASAILNFERIYPATGLRIAADSARIFKDQSWELQGVEVQARQKDGHQITVRARSGVVKQVQAVEQGQVGRIELSGAVQVEREDGFQLQTDALTYVPRDRLVRTRSPVRWSRKNASGSGNGLRYDIDGAAVEILRNASLTVREASPRPQLRGDLVINGHSLLFDLGSGRLRCEGNAVLTQGATHLEAGWVEASLSPDRERMTALQSGGGVEASFAGSSEGGGRRLSSENLDITMASDGDHFQTAIARGRARLVFEPSATRGQREIRAQQLNGTFYPDQDALQRVEASGGISLLLAPRGPGESAREVRARHGWAEMPPGGAADRIHLEGDVLFTGDGRSASGQTGELVEGTLTLTDKPQLLEAQRKIEAESLAYTEKTGALKASGSVRVELSQTNNQELDLKRGPLVITAQQLQHDPESGRAEFSGAVHTQRGDDALDADHLVLMAKSSDFTADGNVRTAFAARGAEPAARRAEGGLFGGNAPALFKSDRLDYSDADGVFHYSGQVVGIQGKDSIRADRLEMTRAGGRLEAHGKVFAVLYGKSIGPAGSEEDPGRRKLTAKADQLHYRDSEQRVTLIGAAEMVQRGRTLTGQQIQVLLDQAGEATQVHAEGTVTLAGPEQKGTCDLLDYDVPTDNFILHGTENEATFYQVGQTAIRGRELSLRGGEGRSVSLLPAEGARVITLHYPRPEELPEKDQKPRVPPP